MLNIALGLLGGLILSWFGFYEVVNVGMVEVFHTTITTTGYYFLFGIFGALRSIGKSFNEENTLTFNKDKK
jgi:hypothetical protein